ncbi:MAG: asparagine synthase-related protein [Candidatus Aminicenantales bacterium]
MADILLRLNGTEDILAKQDDVVERISAGPQGACWVHGKKGTFGVVRHGEDAIASIGYVCYLDGKSVQETLSQILRSFQESQIGDLKKKLIGQYVLLIKKGQRIYLFSDFMGARNIFYSDNGMVISSSFSQVEDLMQTGPSDLDMYKVIEFLAVKHILYPAWLGSSTEHKRIRYLLPYEYLAIDVTNSSFKIGSVVFAINNKKQFDRSALSSELLSALRAIVSRPEFKESPVAASLSGGRDSRLVAATATEYYSKIRYRIAIAPGHYDSLKDMEVAEKLARAQGVPLDVYQFQPGRDEERFRELTEGFSPSFNNKLVPLLEGTGSYSLGFGGVFGTEFFMPIPWESIDKFIQIRIEGAKQALKVEDSFWKSFRESLCEEFRRIKDHFLLSDQDDRDYIRLFILFDTARYGSFIISAFNRSGYQLEPYGSYAVFDLAFRVAPTLWGNHRRFGGDARIQQAAMAKLNPRMARVLTYKNYRPMMPLSTTAFPFYLLGATLQARDVLRRKFDKTLKESTRTDFPGGYYLSGDWAKSFFQRTRDMYGLPFSTSLKISGTGKD